MNQELIVLEKEDFSVSLDNTSDIQFLGQFSTGPSKNSAPVRFYSAEVGLFKINSEELKYSDAFRILQEMLNQMPGIFPRLRQESKRIDFDAISKLLPLQVDQFLQQNRHRFKHEDLVSFASRGVNEPELVSEITVKIDVSRFEPPRLPRLPKLSKYKRYDDDADIEHIYDKRDSPIIKYIFPKMDFSLSIGKKLNVTRKSEIESYRLGRAFKSSHYLLVPLHLPHGT